MEYFRVILESLVQFEMKLIYCFHKNALIYYAVGLFFLQGNSCSVLDIVNKTH